MRTNWRQRHDLGRGKNDGATRSQRIGGRARWRTDNQTVAAIARKRIAIDAHVQFDQARSAAAADDQTVQGRAADVAAGALPAAFQQSARFESEFAVPNPRQRAAKIVRLDRGQEPEAANVDAQNRSARAG